MEYEAIRNILFRTELLRKKFLRGYFLDIGLTIGQGQPRILKNLLKRGPMTQKALADLCMLDVTTMSRTIDRLEEAGLLSRENNPDCRRSYLISLTDKGQKKAEQVVEIFKKVDAVICDGLSERELESLFGLMEKVEKNLREAVDESRAPEA